MALTSKRIRRGGLIVLGCAAATALATVTGVSLASAGPHDHNHHATASAKPDSAALHGKRRPAVVPKITYPDVGINVSASAPASPGRLASAASSPASVLSSFRRQIAPQHVLGSILSSQTPVTSLRVVTELYPTSPDVTARMPYTAWVVTYRNTPCLLLGRSKGGSFPGCKFVGIMDASTGAWTKFFQTTH